MPHRGVVSSGGFGNIWGEPAVPPVVATIPEKRLRRVRGDAFVNILTKLNVSPGASLIHIKSLAARHQRRSIHPARTAAAD